MLTLLLYINNFSVAFFLVRPIVVLVSASRTGMKDADKVVYSLTNTTLLRAVVSAHSQSFLWSNALVL